MNANRFHLALLLLALSPAAAPRALQEEGPAEPAPSTGLDTLVVYSAGAGAFLVDAKDQGLLSALLLLDTRARELPSEIGPALPPDALPLALRALTGPFELRLGLVAADPSAGLPLRAQLRLPEADPAAAAALAERLRGLLESSGLPPGEVDEQGLVRVDFPPVELHHGARGSDVVLAVGKPAEAPRTPSSLGLPEGVEPAFAMEMDISGYMRWIGDMVAMAGPEMDPMLGVLDALDFAGARMSYSYGVGPASSHNVTTIPNYAEMLRATTGIPRGSLSQRTLAMVPRDAVWCSLGTVDFRGTLDMLAGLLEAALEEEDPFGGEDPLEVLAHISGVHLDRDIAMHLGDEWGIYMSPTTGGGGLGSLVALVEVEHAEGLAATLERLGETLNGIAQGQAQGYVQIRRWQRGAESYTSLTFPGLPVPFEPTWALSGGYLVLGLLPQAAVAAAEQAGGRAGSLLDDPDFARLAGGSLEELFALSYTDVPALLEDGYALFSLATSALANAGRSRSDPARGAGLVLPPYPELAAGAQPSLVLARLVGNDLVAVGVGDRSMAVQLTAGLGLASRFPILFMLPAFASAAATRRPGPQMAEAQPEWEELPPEEADEEDEDL